MSSMVGQHLVHVSNNETRKPPMQERGGALAWARQNLFYSWGSTLTTIVLVVLLTKLVVSLFQWGVVNAVWSVPSGPQGTDSTACRALNGSGACWAVIGDKYRFMLFGMYPFEEQWRPALVVALFIGLYIISAMRRFWRAGLAGVWLASLILIGALMWGGVAGLEFVSHTRWGGLALTLILATFGVAFAFPLAILVALGRRSKLPFIKCICVGYVEAIRGVPLITLLFMASVMFPLLMPEGSNLDKLLRAQVAITLFFGAYLAEVIRGGLQALPKGQYEAAHALGMSYWQTNRKIILPQALQLVIPPLVNNFIGFFKDTSLVLVIGLYDLLAASRAAIGEPAWQGFAVETYVFVGLIYFAFCFAMSKYSQSLEVHLNQHRKR